MANNILHATIMQKNTTGGKNIIYPKTLTKNIIDGSSTLDQTLDTLKIPNISNKTTEFTQADIRENLESGETLATSHGKIMKLFSDLKSLAYLDTVGVSNLDSTLLTAYNNRVSVDNVTTSTTITSAGYVADARAVNNLQTQINTVNTNINSKFPEIKRNVMGQGWYRFAKIKAGNIATVMGASGNSVMIAIKTHYSSGGNCCDFILLNNAYSTSNFTVLGSSHYDNNITKIRHTLDSNTSTTYLEFYYANTGTIYSNAVRIELYSTNSAGSGTEWEIMDYELTEETVSGVSVYSSADLVTKDRNAVTNSDLPIMESHLVDPNGSNTIKINLQNNTTVERVQVTLASLIDLQISGMTVRAGAYNTVEIILSKTYSGTIRVNVLYYKT